MSQQDQPLKFSAYTADPAEFATMGSRLAGLSRYVDNAATAFMRGRAEAASFDGFKKQALAIYGDLREELISCVTDEELRTQGEAAMRHLDADADILETALTIDQAHGWVMGVINRDSIVHQIAVSEFRMAEELKSLTKPQEHTRPPGAYA